ncbi:MAG TPA: class I SAM-dependent RNA methyltransferase [Stellaceae bacterium]|nr:class I SAM-dependent RNA methyltransferase [Stellaceae bacterium]
MAKAKRPKKSPPVELVVERIGAHGDGIAHYAGEPVFLPFTAPGDRVRARLGLRRGGGHEGRVLALLSPGPGRARPPCPHFSRCGGCALQHLDADAYRRAKRAALATALARIGVDPETIEPLRTVPPGRRRARLGLVRPRDPQLPVRIGFRERFRHELVDLRQCPVLEEGLLALVEPLRHYARDLLPPGGMAEALLTRTDSGVDLLFEAAAPPGIEALETLAGLAAERDLARAVWRCSGVEIPVVERRPVRLLLSGVAVRVPPGAFLQASAAAEAILVEEVVGGVGVARPALDLFAGLGAFAFALRRGGPQPRASMARAGTPRVHAVEGDRSAAAALAAAAAGVSDVTVERRDLARDPLRPDELARYAAAVFDPPRAGALAQAEALAASSLAAIVAVSCNPATFARDASRLLAGGFRPVRIVPIDQFVWTPHLEIAALFRRPLS